MNLSISLNQYPQIMHFVFCNIINKLMPPKKGKFEKKDTKIVDHILKKMLCV